MTQTKLVVIGGVVKPHGIRGEFSVVNHADSPALYSPGRRLGIRAPGKPERSVEVKTCRPHQGRLLLTIDGVTDRDAADALRGMEIVVPADEMPDLDEGEVYLHELVGFDVVLVDGATVGVLEGFLDVPGQDLWVIRSPEGKEILLPAHEETVPEIDMDGRRIVINPPPGLLEL